MRLAWTSGSARSSPQIKGFKLSKYLRIKKGNFFDRNILLEYSFGWIKIDDWSGLENEEE